MRKLWVLGLTILLLFLTLKTYTQIAATNARTAQLHQEVFVLSKHNQQIRAKKIKLEKIRQTKINRLKHILQGKQLAYMASVWVDIATKVGIDWRLEASIYLAEESGGYLPAKFNAYGFSFPPCDYRYCSWTDRTHEAIWVAKQIKFSYWKDMAAREVLCHWSISGCQYAGLSFYNKI